MPQQSILEGSWHSSKVKGHLTSNQTIRLLYPALKNLSSKGEQAKKCSNKNDLNVCEDERKLQQDLHCNRLSHLGVSSSIPAVENSVWRLDVELPHPAKTNPRTGVFNGKWHNEDI